VSVPRSTADDRPATAADVAACFLKVHAYYKRLAGLAAEGAANGEKAVARQYGGRVAFELLQNALDRASGRIAVRRHEGRLLVANDGRPVSCDPDFNPYGTIDAGNRPSNFHALCSMHTSSKNPDDDNGNKGVGFRSTFSVSACVSVWSRLASGGWWGIRLLRELTAEGWVEAADTPEVRAALQRFAIESLRAPPLNLGERRPSYHFPLPLYAEHPPGDGLDDWAVTVVELACDSDQSAQSIADSVRALQESHLEFIGLRGRPVVHVELDDARLTTAITPGLVDAWRIDAPAEPALFASAHTAGLDIRRSIGGAVRWPPPGGRAGHVYCYLATAVSCPFHIDLHADLQTGIDRKHLEVSAAESVGAYNRQLLLRGLRAHHDKVERDGLARDDLWRMLDPGPLLRDVEEHREPVRYLLGWEAYNHWFGAWSSNSACMKSGFWSKWAAFAARYFDGRARPASAYKQFWAATEHWINSVYPSHHSNAKHAATACLAALRETGARVVPITRTRDGSDGVAEAVVPPTLGEAGTRSDDRLFHVTIAQLEHFAAVLVPEAVRRRNRRVTAWSFPAAFCSPDRLIGSASFERASLLQELRQLPVRLEDDAGLSPDEQEDVLVFAAQLFHLRVAAGKATTAYADGPHAPGWRADHDEKPSEEVSAGRAIATLFLLRTDGLWAPARQLRREELDAAFLSRIAGRVPGLAVEDFLTFLGVATWPGRLRLVEGADEGVVSPRSTPPPLSRPTNQALPPLGVPLSIEGDPEDLAARLDEAWSARGAERSWLCDMARREGDRPGRYRVLSGLGRAEWFPVGGGGGALPPTHAASVPERVAPRTLTLLPPRGQRLETLVWRVRPDSSSEPWLRALGAHSLDDRLNDPALAAELLRDLARDLPEPSARIEASPELHFMLTEAFRRALDAVVKQSGSSAWAAGLPLLSESAHPRRLRWVRPEETYVASDKGDRESVRRLAPELPLLAAVIGPKQIEGTTLSDRGIALSSRVEATEARSDGPARDVRGEIEPLLPGLLALAETSRAYDRAVDAELVALRWHATELLQARDVWRVYSLVGSGVRRELTDSRSAYGDVMHTLDRGAQDPVGEARVYYDVPPDGDRPRLPLAWFAESLASVLLDRGAEHDWRAALSEFDAGKRSQFDAYLRRRGVPQELVDAMQAGLEPLPEAELTAHRVCTEDVLRRFGIALSDLGWDANGARTLSPGRQLDLSTAKDSCEEDVNRALDEAAWTAAGRRFVPRIDVKEAHVDAWRRWEREEHRRIRLFLWWHRGQFPDREPPREAELLSPSSEVARLLDKHVETLAASLRFSPDAVARAWCGAGDSPIEAWLPPYAEFRPVTRAPSEAAFARVPAPPPRPSTRVLLPLTQAERDVNDAAKAVKGDRAEEAFLHWVTASTLHIIERFGEHAWKVLRGAVPEGSRVSAQLADAQRAFSPETLSKALWISHYWGGAGYDLLALEERKAEVIPVRYEVKSLPDGRRVRVFLSTNELAVYRATHGSTGRADLRTGDWRLVGVRKNGTAIDLTSALAPVLDAGGGALATLASDGFAPDALQMLVDLPGDAVSPARD
jgi:hypothetical protein